VGFDFRETILKKQKGIKNKAQSASKDSEHLLIHQAGG
jgi:hypothetical protein